MSERPKFERVWLDRWVEGQPRVALPLPGTGRPELDPRWEWVEAPRQLCDPTPRYVKGRCRHVEVVPVEAGGETVACLCLTCDTQLPAEWRP